MSLFAAAAAMNAGGMGLPNQGSAPTTAKLGDSSSNPTSKSAKGAVYSQSDIDSYRASTETSIKNYSTLSAQQKTTATAPEFVGIKGAISVPAASSYDDAKTSINELAANAGDLASAANAGNIELCGFLSNLPSIDIDMSAPQLGIPALQDIMKAVNGISMPALEFGSDAIVGIIGGASKALGDLSSALQSNVPTITCGSVPLVPPVSPATLASALIPGGPIITALAPIALKQIGITPPINVTSPDVTVQALNDVLEAGEF